MCPYIILSLFPCVIQTGKLIYVTLGSVSHNFIIQNFNYDKYFECLSVFYNDRYCLINML